MPSSVPVGGIRMSVMTTLGWAWSIDAISSSRSAHIAWISMSGSPARMVAMPSRTSNESSATVTLMLMSES